MIRVVNQRLVGIQIFSKYVHRNCAFVTDPYVYFILMLKHLAELMKFISSICKYVTVA